MTEICYASDLRHSKYPFPRMEMVNMQYLITDNIQTNQCVVEGRHRPSADVF